MLCATLLNNRWFKPFLTQFKRILWILLKGLITSERGIIHLEILLIPIETCHTTSLVRVNLILLHCRLKSRSDFLVVVEIVININIVSSTCQRHGDIAIVVKDSLISLTPLRSGSRSPCAVILIDRLSKLIVMVYLTTLVLRAPVHLGNHNRIGLYHWHLISELLDSIVRIITIITCSIPASIVMHGITDVLTSNRIVDIVTVIALVSSARNQDDALEAILTNLIHDRLEEVMQRLLRTLSISKFHINRLVSSSRLICPQYN